MTNVDLDRTYLFFKQIEVISGKNCSVVIQKCIYRRFQKSKGAEFSFLMPTMESQEDKLQT